MGLIFNPRWEWRDPTIRGGIPPDFLPGKVLLNLNLNLKVRMDMDLNLANFLKF